MRTCTTRWIPRSRWTMPRPSSFLEVWKSVTRRLKPGRRRSSRTWNRSPSWKADRGAVCGDSKRWSGFHDRSATELQRLSAVAAK
ncbi:hypothetical protein [Ralstonia phage RSM1]|uniref:Uncharacterized protein n=1 Tax=Ralstonia phage RSM1 TaxID=384359 RepID=A0JC10_9VIRU|nr:hypothetical protein RPRV1_gp06 [Ralstonia phage RSM1]BAF36512.1 hypothetical protein [Ralstonia phage RSM1]